MCLVLSIILTALAFNFYLNGFILQAGIMALLAIGFTFLMIRNMRCRFSACNIAKEDEKGEKEDETSSS